MLSKTCFKLIAALMVILFVFSGCAQNKPIIEEDSGVVINGDAVKNGDVVKVDYTGNLTDGTQFDSSKGRAPLEFTVGAGQMIAGFDAAVVGMKVGQTKKVTIPAAQAYGEHQDNMVLEVPKENLPPDMTPKIGDHLATMQPNGRQLEVVITAVNDSSVIIDANHFLAGKDLTFEITLVEIGK
jgi:peptidylprolyl isomerase